jgi:Transmembrane exosortase (Exosortase_EpsH)
MLQTLAVTQPLRAVGAEIPARSMRAGWGDAHPDGNGQLGPSAATRPIASGSPPWAVALPERARVDMSAQPLMAVPTATRSPVTDGLLPARNVRSHIGFPTWGPTLRALILVGATASAYKYSLATLYLGVARDRMLAYPALVPPLAVGLALVINKRPRCERPIHDRQLDYILGVPLVLVALFLVAVLPSHLSTSYWLWRLDLLSLPLFAAGGIAILFGTRALGRMGLPLAFLVLAWPFPYRLFSQFTTTLGGSCNVWHAEPGVVIVASALGTLAHARSRRLRVRAQSWRKLAWLSTGVVLASLVALVLRDVVGVGSSTSGSASCSLTPVPQYLQYLPLVVVFLVLGATMRPFGLAVWSRVPASTDRAVTGTGSVTARFSSAVALLVALSLIMGLLDVRLDQYSATVDPLGWPTLHAVTAPPSIGGGSWVPITMYQVGRRYFGSDSNWSRYRFQASESGPSWEDGRTLFADVVSTNQPTELSSGQAIEASRLLNARVTPVQLLNLGWGVTGDLVCYSGGGDGKWCGLLWELPIRSGMGIHYQALVLSLREGSTAQDPGQTPPILLTIALLLGLHSGGSSPSGPDGSPVIANLVSASRSALRSFISFPLEEGR